MRVLSSGATTGPRIRRAAQWRPSWHFHVYNFNFFDEPVKNYLLLSRSRSDNDVALVILITRFRLTEVASSSHMRLAEARTCNDHWQRSLSDPQVRLDVHSNANDVN
jgi:hypothetical protein